MRCREKHDRVQNDDEFPFEEKKRLGGGTQPKEDCMKKLDSPKELDTGMR